MTESDIDFDQNDHDHDDLCSGDCVTIKSEIYLEV